MKDPNLFYIDRLLDNCEANSTRITAPDGNKLKEATRHEYERFANKLNQEIVTGKLSI